MTDTQDLSTLYLTADITEKPETNKNHLRLYGHHLCPFVEKARLALAARGGKSCVLASRLITAPGGECSLDSACCMFHAVYERTNEHPNG